MKGKIFPESVLRARLLRLHLRQGGPVYEGVVLDWITDHEHLLGWLTLFSVLFFVGSILAIPAVIVCLPRDFFTRPSMRMSLKEPMKCLGVVIKNLLGFIFFVLGILMLFLPGQGLLSILLGISLLDIPGKRKWQLALVRRPGVRRAIDWIRLKASRPPLEIPKPADP